MKYLVCNFKNKLLKDEIIKYNTSLGNIETKVKKFKKLVDKHQTKCYSIIAVSEKRWLLTDKK